MGRGRPRLSTIKMSPSFDKYTSNRIKQLQYALGKGGLTDKDERSIRDEIIKIQALCTIQEKELHKKRMMKFQDLSYL